MRCLPLRCKGTLFFLYMQENDENFRYFQFRGSAFGTMVYWQEMYVGKKTSILGLKIKFRAKRLHMCIFFCTFARFFAKQKRND